MKRIGAALGFLVLAAAPLQPVWAVEHVQKKVIALRVNDGNQCVIFKLEGVIDADPVSAGGPSSAWFALPPTHPRFAEAVSFLIAATAGGLLVNIKTTGQKATTCGAGDAVGVSMVGFP